MINNNLQNDSPDNWEQISQQIAGLESVRMPVEMNERIFSAVNNRLDNSVYSKKWLVYAGSVVIIISSFMGWKYISYDAPPVGISKIEISAPEKKKQKRVQYVKRALPKPAMKAIPNVVPVLEAPEHIHPVNEKIKPVAPVDEVTTGGEVKK